MANAGSRDMVLVTGAAGFIGFHVAARLLRERVPVLGIDNFDPAYDRETKETNVRDLRAASAHHEVPFEFAVQDICRIEPRFADGRLCGVVHLAARTGVRHSIGDAEAYAQTNVVGTLRILELCRAQGIDRLLFASSSSVYGDDTPPPFGEDARADRPLSPYAASKRAGELFCASYAHLHGVRAAALRFFTVYGPRQRPHLAIHEFTRRIDRGEPVPLFGDGSSERGYTYIDDVVDGVLPGGTSRRSPRAASRCSTWAARTRSPCRSSSSPSRARCGSVPRSSRNRSSPGTCIVLSPTPAGRGLSSGTSLGCRSRKDCGASLHGIGRPVPTRRGLPSRRCPAVSRRGRDRPSGASRSSGLNLSPSPPLGALPS